MTHCYVLSCFEQSSANPLPVYRNWNQFKLRLWKHLWRNNSEKQNSPFRFSCEGNFFFGMYNGFLYIIIIMLLFKSQALFVLAHAICVSCALFCIKYQQQKKELPWTQTFRSRFCLETLEKNQAVRQNLEWKAWVWESMSASSTQNERAGAILVTRCSQC